jgi:Uma2 family endonuclease
MNLHVPGPVTQKTTQAAEGLPRWKWSVAEIIRMVEAGIIREHERFELIGGEIVPMSPKGVFHETVKKQLNKFWSKFLPPDIDILTETTLCISAHDYLEPDFVFWPSSIPIKDLAPKDILLLVECADSSLAYDLGRKALIYASIGIREYWAIDAKAMVTHVHHLGTGDTYPEPIRVPHTDLLTPGLLPTLAVRLADVGLTPSAE